MAIQTEVGVDPNRLPQHVDTLLQVRTGKIKPVFTISERSAIFKTPLKLPVMVTTLGCDGDEQAFKNHGGPDKALMQYASQHYALWKEEIPENTFRLKRNSRLSLQIPKSHFISMSEKTTCSAIKFKTDNSSFNVQTG